MRVNGILLTFSPSEMFVVLTADQFVGRDDGLWFHSIKLFCCFSRCKTPTNSVAPYFYI